MKLFKMMVLCFAFGSLAILGVAQTANTSKSEGPKMNAEMQRFQGNPVIATVDGEPVYLSDVINKRIYDLQSQLYEALVAELPQYALEKLAKSHEEINTVPDIEITEKQIETFYKLNGLQQRGPLTQFRDLIANHLRQQAEAQHYMSQLELALNNGWVTTYLEPPPEFTAVASTKTAFLRGNEKAKVMLLEFSDYQCPFCGRVQPTIDTLLEKYGDQVAFGYRHFPLQFHTEADEAAIAAECAREQGKFTEMHKLLYTRQRNQHIGDLKTYARQIKVPDLKKFDQCLDNEKYRDLVNNDLSEGAELGINGTPGFMIGIFDPKAQTVSGEVLSGAQPQSAFESLLQKYLSKKS